MTDKPRNADVTALCYCNVLALFRRDFTSLLEREEKLRETINRVARERLGESPA